MYRCNQFEFASMNFILKRNVCTCLITFAFLFNLLLKFMGKRSSNATGHCRALYFIYILHSPQTPRSSSVSDYWPLITNYMLEFPAIKIFNSILCLCFIRADDDADDDDNDCI